jgi:hypothetical protein
MEKTILALHPDPTKQGVPIEKNKYEAVRSAIIATLKSNGSMSFTDLGNMVEDRLRKNFEGSILWYYTTVKLDLEARKEIRRVPKTSPQMIELAL